MSLEPSGRSRVIPRRSHARNTITLGIAVAALAGCRGSGRRVDLKAVVVAVTRDEVTVEVTAEPGMNIGATITLGKGEGIPTGPDGVGRVVLPRARWAHYDGSEIEVSAYASGFPKGRYGSTKAKLPVAIKSLTAIGPDGIGVLALGGGSRAESVPLALEGEPSRPRGPGRGGGGDASGYWQPRERRFPVTVAAPPGAKLTLAGTSVVAAPLGLTTLELDSEEVPKNVAMESLNNAARASTAGNTAALTLTLEVAPPAAAPVRRELTWRMGTRTLPWLTATLDAVARDVRFTGVPVVDATLLRRTSGVVTHFGASGRVGQARWVALESAAFREGASCAYQGFGYRIRYEDISVRVLDTRTGQQVATTTFPSPKASCLLVASSADRGEKIYRVGEATLTAWFERGMAKNFR